MLSCRHTSKTPNAHQSSLTHAPNHKTPLRSEVGINDTMCDKTRLSCAMTALGGDTMYNR